MSIRLLLAARAARDVIFHRVALAHHLEDTFGISARDTIRDITIGLGDAHYGGKTVTRVHFKSGKTIIYKPRPGSSAIWFKRVHDAVVALLPDRLSLKFPSMVDGGNHVWEDDISVEGCGSRNEVQLFYERAGLLLALCRLCRSTDLHGENIVASGGYPVPIDTEAFASPAGYGAARHDPNANLWFAATAVSDLDILPHDVRTCDGLLRRESSFASRSVSSSETVCGPIFDGRQIPVEDFADTLVKGFRLASHAIWARQIRDGWADIFSDLRYCQPRILLRPTQLYASLGREVLGTFVECSHTQIEMELVTRLLASSNSQESAAIARAEARSMLLGDVPTFTLRTGTLDRLILKPITDTLQGPSATLCDPRDFSPPETQREVSLIQKSIGGRG
ncbi:DUF4135 domain-containing protein [Paracoccus aestuariivivens]|nr:DUF4135 domain-containing protein [Paracoccus aestuariivivens]